MPLVKEIKILIFRKPSLGNMGLNIIQVNSEMSLHSFSLRAVGKEYGAVLRALRST
jgi:hypothetical protein